MRNDISLRNTPLRSIKKYLSDMISVTGMSHSGIFSTGVAKPDISMDGTITTNAPKTPCC